MKNIKKILKTLLNFSKLFGYKININKISSNTKYTLVDKNSWEPFLNIENNYIFKIYNEAIKKSQSEYSDSFLKQLSIEPLSAKSHCIKFLEAICSASGLTLFNKFSF